MTRRKWTFELDGREHTVELEHTYISSKRVITLDEVEVHRSSKLVDAGSQHSFPIDGHECVIYIRPKGLAYSYDCVVDGRSVATGKEVKPPPSTPGWAWFFVAACGVIPFVALGGAIPVLIGAAGAYACLTIAQKSSGSMKVRAAMCAGVTVLCWVLYAAAVVGTTLLRT